MSAGKIIRRLMPFERNFTQIPNQFLTDVSISLPARGLLALLMSFKDGQEVTIAGLVADGHGKRDFLEARAQELERAGYLTRIAQRKRGGQFQGYDWELTEPLTSLVDSLAIPGYRSGSPVANRYGSPATAQTATAQTATARAERTVTAEPEPIRNNTSNTLSSSPSVSYDDDAPVDNSGPRCRDGHPLDHLTGGGIPVCRNGDYGAAHDAAIRASMLEAVTS